MPTKETFKIIEKVVDDTVREVNISAVDEVKKLENNYSTRGLILSSVFINELIRLHLKFIEDKANNSIDQALKIVKIAGEQADNALFEYLRALIDAHLIRGCVTGEMLKKYIPLVYPSKYEDINTYVGEKVLDQRRHIYDQLEVKIFILKSRLSSQKQNPLNIHIGNNYGSVQTGSFSTASIDNSTSTAKEDYTALIDSINSLVLAIQRDREGSSSAAVDSVEKYEAAIAELKRSSPDYNHALSLISTASSVVSAIPAIKPAYAITKSLVSQIFGIYFS